MKEKIKEAYKKAIEVLEKCSTPHGFNAAYPGYDALWSRDGMIMSLGASLIGTKFKETIAKSISELAKYQSEKGQIPNAIDIYSTRRKHVDFQSVDSTLWFIIGNFVYKERFNDSSLLKDNLRKIKKGLAWIDCLDTGEDGMPEQQPTSDWFDAFPHRYGHTINTQALYYKTLKLNGEDKRANKLKWAVHEDIDNKLWNGNFYLPWRWKNHNKYQEKGEWFESLGNLLAIVYDLADKETALKILNYIEKKKIASPYPMKSLYPPIYKDSKDWYDYFSDSEAGKPYHYANAGIWTFIGGFYVCALVKYKKFREAEKQLAKLAEANTSQNSNFTEWLNGKTGKPGNSASGKNNNQGWNAAMYIAAFESVEKRRCLI
ncbi:hypothetical protein HY450_03575 [Candidatus Pacearchaeota archaeon]|nr:hypothetical protein [Candidatus Pacearchaeota archaeon]